MNNKVIGAVIAGVVVLGGLFGGIACIEKINAGYVGVVYSMKSGVEGETLGQGWHIVSPMKKVTEYSISTEQGFLAKESKSDNSFSIPTSDGKMVNVDVEYSYHFDAEMLPKTFSQFKGRDGKDIEDTFIKGKIKSWSQEVSATYSVMDIYGSKRAELNKATFDHVKKNFSPYGIVIDSINFSRIGLDEQTEKAIQERVNAQQELEKVKIDKEKAELEADKAKIEAQGKAEVTRINAEAEANANKLKQTSLTDNIVKYEAIKKWDGRLPAVSGGSTPIIDMSDIMTSK